MHECIRKLLVQTDEESLECLCRLVTTVGALLEEETNAMIAKGGQTPGFSNLDEYFTSMDKIIKEKKTSSRVRFLMQVNNVFIAKNCHFLHVKLKFWYNILVWLYRI